MKNITNNIDFNTSSVAVVGGANIDIKGTSYTLFRHNSSNPGLVYKSAGGVGRNIAENLGRLQVPTSFYSVIGDDSEGEWLLNYTEKSGVNVNNVIKISGKRTGQYLSLLDEEKELIGSIADMGIMECFNYDLLIKLLPNISSAKIMFVDVNLPRETMKQLIEWAHNKNITIIIDPVSSKKAIKLKGLLKGIKVFTPNLEEAEILSGITINSNADLINVSKYFLDVGVENLILTMGSKGVYVANKDKQELLESPKVEIKDTTGAGDAFVAGVIYALINNMDIFYASTYGMALAEITLYREETVADDLSIDLLENTRKKMG